MTGAAELAGLLERDGELRRLQGVVGRACEGGGAAALVEGSAGIGKTTLVAATVSLARARGMRVLRGRGGTFETAFGYGVVRQLFEGVLRGASGDERRALLAGSAWVARGVSVLEGEPDPEPLAVQHGLYWLVVNLAAGGPLLICVDDGHWADTASLSFLVYLVRRLEGLGVAVVVASRTDPHAGAGLLAALRDEPDVEVIRPAALTEPASVELVRRAFGRRTEVGFGRACHEVSGGNPFLLTELVRSLGEEGVPPTAAGSQRVRVLAPEGVVRSVIVRLARLSPAARALALAAAVLGDDVEIRHAATLAELTGQQAQQAVQELVAASIVTVDGTTLRFAHSMLASAVYSQFSAAAAAAAHLQAARVLDDAGVTDGAAAHLLRAAPTDDGWLVDRLTAAASRASPRQAVPLLERALELAAPDQRAGVLVALGQAGRAAGSPDAFVHLEQGLAVAEDRDLREQALLALAQDLALSGRGDDAVALLEAEIVGLPAAEAERARRLEGHLAQVAVASDGALPRVAPRLRRVVTEGSGPARRSAAAALMMQAYESGEVGPAALVASAEDVLAQGLLENLASESLVVSWVLLVLARVEAYERATEVADAALAAAEQQGSLFPAAVALSWRGRVGLSGGSLTAAQADLEAALRVAEPAGVPSLLQFIVASLVEALVARGHPAEADALLDRHGWGDGYEGLEGYTLLARARLRLAQDRAPDTASDARRLLAIAEARGVTCPAIGVRPILARALLTGHARAEALQLVDDELDLALRGGIPGEIGSARRDRAVVRGTAQGLDELATAADELAVTPRRVDHAHALVELGAALRRAQRRSDAHAPLRWGLEIADALGAGPLAERARRELAIAGARPRRVALSGVAALTPAELRVAELAAEGRSNDGIAQALFVTRKTVETQLSAAYRKLGVSGRHQLPAALGTAGPAPDG